MKQEMISVPPEMDPTIKTKDKLIGATNKLTRGRGVNPSAVRPKYRGRGTVMKLALYPKITTATWQ